MMVFNRPCPLCGAITTESDPIKGGSYRHYRCSNCAEFVIAADAEASMSHWTKTTRDQLIQEAKATTRPEYIYVITAQPQPGTTGPWLQGAPQLRSEVLDR